MFGFQWHLTDRCQLRCRHCYQDRFVSAGEPGPEVRRGLADTILGGCGSEPVSINLTGGEPLLLPDLVPLIAHLHTFANLDDLCIITNGLAGDAALLGELGRWPKLTWFKVSVESGDEAVNDAIRGAGNLSSLRRRIPELADRTGRPVVLMMTLARYNLGGIAPTVDFARAVGAAGLIFERFVPLGTGAPLADQVLTADEWATAVTAIISVAGQAGTITPTDLAACRAFWLHLDRAGDESLDVALCNLGEHAMALMPDGTVHPCRRLPIAIGDLIREPLALVRARLAAWRPDRVRPRLDPGLCRNCRHDDCAGCRALVRALTGAVLGDDRQCLLIATDRVIRRARVGQIGRASRRW